jgi:hypothetical protein
LGAQNALNNISQKGPFSKNAPPPKGKCLKKALDIDVCIISENHLNHNLPDSAFTDETGTVLEMTIVQNGE